LANNHVRFLFPLVCDLMFPVEGHCTETSF
jgi:hypothetical protein